MIEPMIDAFLKAHGELRPATHATLEAAADVRRAAAEALPADRFRADPSGAPFRRAEDQVWAALGAAESLAEGAFEAEAMAECLRQLQHTCLQLRVESHRHDPRRSSTSATARKRLFEALRVFERCFDTLKQEALAAHARLPWQLELSAHVAPGTSVQAMRFWGYDLPRTPVVSKPWGERCFFSGQVFDLDCSDDPEPRYRSLDSLDHTLTPKYRDFVARLRTLLQKVNPMCPEAARRLVRRFPILGEDFVLATSHPSFTRLGLLDFPSLAVSLNNLLRVHAGRPLFGSREMSESPSLPTRLPSIGVADRAAVVCEGKTSGYGWLTYDEVRRHSLHVSWGFERLGLKPGDRVGLLMTGNCPDFYVVDFGAIFSNLISVGLAETQSDAQLTGIVEITEMRAVVTDRTGRERLDRLFGTSGPMRIDLTELKHGEGPTESWQSASGIGFSTAVLHGDEISFEAARSLGIVEDGEQDLFTILLTSGSTGRPKGTVVSRRRWAEEMCFEASVWPHVSVSFQPSAIAADRASVWRCLSNGGRVGFARRGAALFEDLQALRPTIFDAPPVVWNTVYSDYKRAIEDPLLSRREIARARRRARDLVGGRLVFMAVGGAPSDPGMRRTLEEVLGVKMSEGYGTTETGNIAADGSLLPGLDYRLIDVPELGYSSGDRPYPRGELAVRTARATSNYWQDEASTSRGFTSDGYFLTGDLVAIGPGRNLTILGRRQQSFKLAGSEFVSPAELESHFATSELVEAIVVTASPLASSIVVIAVPATAEVGEMEILADLRCIARLAKLRPSAVPAGVVLAPKVSGALPFTAENGLLTASMKLNRRAIEERYRDAIEKVYEPRLSKSEAMATAVVEAENRASKSRAAQLKRMVATLLAVPEEEVDVDRSFSELGGDSMTAMDFVLRLEQVFGGKGEATDLLAEEVMTTPLRQLVEVADSKSETITSAAPTPQSPQLISEQPPEAPISEGLIAEQQLETEATPEAIAAQANFDAANQVGPEELPPPTEKSNVFITGATGFLGIHLLSHLARTLPDEVCIFALIRATDDEAAVARLESSFKRARLDTPQLGTITQLTRVRALAGHLDQQRFGLSDHVFAQLETEVGCILHVAAMVSFGKSYLELRPGNVEGTRRVLELATSVTLKAVHFVSSLNVAQLLKQAGQGAFEESSLPDELETAVVAAQPGYAVSKWVCERMVRELMKRSRGTFKASVSRPALVSWSKTTGYSNADDWLSRVLSSCLQVRATLGGEEAGVLRRIPLTAFSARGLDLVPVDYTASAICRILELTRTSRLPGPSRATWHPVPTFHVSNISPALEGHPTTARLMDLLALAADQVDAENQEALEPVSFGEWELRVDREDAAARPILRQLRQMAIAVERTQARRFAALMTGAEPCPTVDSALLAAFIRGARI